jgi:type VI secretion system protein ImpF
MLGQVMAEFTPTDRLQPCLLDRLTDENPEVKAEGREQRVVSLRRYRHAVLRDLAMLFNSRAHPTGSEIYEYPEAASSVLNYGIPDLAGASVPSAHPAEFPARVKRAILGFEPRISGNALSVRIISPSASEHVGVIQFEIEGELWAQPLPERLFVKTEVDLETGRHALEGESGG